MKRFVIAAAICAVALFGLAAASRADDEAPAAYAKFTDGMTSQKGLFAVWSKAGKTYLELSPAQLDHDYILSAVPRNGLGGYFINAGAGDYFAPHIIRFTRQDNKVLIVFPNEYFIAPKNTADARAIEEQTAKSVVGVAKIAATDDKTGNIVIDASPLLGDVIDFADSLKAALGNPEPGKLYHLDADRSFFGPAK